MAWLDPMVTRVVASRLHILGYFQAPSRTLEARVEGRLGPPKTFSLEQEGFRGRRPLGH